MCPASDDVQCITSSAMIEVRFDSGAMHRLGDANAGAKRHCAVAFD
jgi:hypothetical protein